MLYRGLVKIEKIHGGTRSIIKQVDWLSCSVWLARGMTEQLDTILRCDAPRLEPLYLDSTI